MMSSWALTGFWSFVRVKAVVCGSFARWAGQYDDSIQRLNIAMGWDALELGMLRRESERWRTCGNLFPCTHKEVDQSIHILHGPSKLARLVELLQLLLELQQ